MVSDSESKELEYRNVIKKLTMLNNEYEEFINKYNEAHETLAKQNKKGFSFFK